MSSDTLSIESPALAVEEAEPRRITYEDVLRSPAFIPGLVALVGILSTFWGLISKLPDLWFADDGYYSHGVLVPIISGYVIYRWWPRLRSIPVKPGYIALPFVIGLMLVYRAAHLADIQQLRSVAFIATLLAAIWFVAGFRWMLALCLPTIYLIFMLPIWTGAIDVYTNPLQIQSTKVAYHMLNLIGFSPTEINSTTIMLDHFTLDVGVPCSGLKLLLAVTAFMFFFLMIATLKWWGKLAMMAIVIPLCLFINGLRIALIGVVGDMHGEKAGMAFHDYSGYITLLICFFILFRFARTLGWKD